MSLMFELSEGASARAPTGEETSPGRADQRPDDVDAEQEQVQSCVTGVPEARAEHSGGVRRREHGLQADHQRRGRGGKATCLITFEGWGGWSRRNEQERKPRRNKIIQRRHCRHCSECSSLMNNSKTRMACFRMQIYI